MTPPVPRPAGRALVLAVTALLCLPMATLAATVVDRDEYSTTVDAGGGKLKTSLSSEPVNYQTDSGDWKPIDTTLAKEADGDLHPQAVDGDVAIPASLSQPIELEHDDHAASFRLLGATGSADVDDETASFDHALQGVDAAYATRADGVKETLTLATPFAPHTFLYDLTGGAAWSATLADGDVVLKDGSGVERYRISAPLAWDSAADPSFTNALVLSVSKLGDGHWRVTLRPDESWLTGADRVYPVSIDPDFTWANGTTHFHGAQDCYLASLTQANYTFCAAAYLTTGYYNRAYNSLLKFDIASAIPSNASVSSATFKAYAPPASPKAAAPHSLYTVTSDWDSNATWNNRKTGVPWTTAGGDISTNAAYTSSATSVSTNPAWYSWTAPTATVQGWINGSLPNYGFLLKMDSAPGCCSYVFASTEASTSSQFPADSTQWPTLDVTWTQPASGDTTAPPPPTDLDLGALDPVDGTAVLSFQLPADTAPSGQTPSGLASADFRTAVNGGAMSAWTTVTGTERALTGFALGDTVNVEIRSHDVAGNTSTASSASFTVKAPGDAPPIDTIEAAEFAGEYQVSQTSAMNWLTAQTMTNELLEQLGSTTVASSVSGAWFDDVAQKVHVQLLGSRADALTSSYASDAGLQPYLQVDHVTTSAHEIQANEQTAQQQLGAEIAADHLRTFSDLKTNVLRLFLSTAASASERAHVTSVAQAFSPQAVVMDDDRTDEHSAYMSGSTGCARVAEPPAAGTPFRNVYCDGAMRGGMDLLNGSNAGANQIPPSRVGSVTGSCSSAFNVTTSQGQPALLTAGHCLSSVDRNTGAPVTRSPTWSGLGYGVFGVVGRWQFGGDSSSGPQSVGSNDYIDGGALNYDVSKLSRVDPIAYLGAGSIYGNGAVRERFSIDTPMPDGRADGRMLPGQWVCALGGRTGTHCGQFLAYNNTNDQSFEWTGCGTYHGDSGSPVVAGHHAAGVFSQSRWVSLTTGAEARRNYTLWLYKPFSEGGYADDAKPFIAPCNFFGEVFNVKQVNIATSIDDVESYTGTTVMTKPWRKPGTASAAGEYVRADLSWNTRANLDLHVWDASGAHAQHAGHQEQAISGSRLTLDVTKGYGPETFLESASSSERQYDFGICYENNGPLAHSLPTEARLTLTKRDGTTTVRRITLAAPGAFAAYNSAPSGSVAGHKGWCNGSGNAAGEDSVDGTFVPPKCGPGETWSGSDGGCLIIY